MSQLKQLCLTIKSEKGEHKQKPFRRKVHSVSSVVVAVETPADLSKILNSSLLPLLTSIPAFLYIPVCFDALETTRFTRCLLCSSPSPVCCLHTVSLIGKIFAETLTLEIKCSWVVMTLNMSVEYQTCCYVRCSQFGGMSRLFIQFFGSTQFHWEYTAMPPKPHHILFTGLSKTSPRTHPPQRLLWLEICCLPSWLKRPAFNFKAQIDSR